MKYINNLTKLALVAAVISFTSCKDEGGLAAEYMPDMYRSPTIETYVDYGELRGKQGNDSLKNRLTALQPVKGTIARGFTPYPYENTAEGYELAGQQYTSPFSYTDESIADGKALYGMFCVHCHGKTGQGDGMLVQRDKFPPIPTKFNESLDLAEGKMFHTITYGKGLMGSHAPQLNKEERWKLIHYIRSDFMKKRPAAPVASNGLQGVEGGNVVEGMDMGQGVAFTGNLGSDLDLIFDFYDQDNPDFEALPNASPAVVLLGISFKQLRAKLNIEKSTNTLDLVASKLKQDKYQHIKILLSGHTHKGPNEKLNVSLSEKRAVSVKEYLVEKGVDASRISTKGYGSSQLLSEDDADKNRRTEITVVK